MKDNPDKKENFYYQFDKLLKTQKELKAQIQFERDKMLEALTGIGATLRDMKSVLEKIADVKEEQTEQRFKLENIEKETKKLKSMNCEIHAIKIENLETNNVTQKKNTATLAIGFGVAFLTAITTWIFSHGGK